MATATIRYPILYISLIDSLHAKTRPKVYGVVHMALQTRVCVSPLSGVGRRSDIAATAGPVDV